jgi:transcriptional regulator with XRE-family HTH domain
MKKPSFNASKIAGNIKKRRTTMKISRDELAKRAKVNYNTIIKIESGANKNPTVKTLIGVASVLGCGIEDLLK